jgi:hypothetical protein
MGPAKKPENWPIWKISYRNFLISEALFLIIKLFQN